MTYLEELQQLFKKHSPPLTDAETQKLARECTRILEREKRRQQKKHQ